MKVSITFRHMDASDALRDHVNARIDHFRKFLIKPNEVHVMLSVEKFRHRAEVVLMEQNFHAKADEVTDDMYKSIDVAMDKIEKQVRKHKDKVQEHHKHHLGVSEVAALEESEFEKSQSVE
jgi:putative sigma-54 modulation protein